MIIKTKPTSSLKMATLLGAALMASANSDASVIHWSVNQSTSNGVPLSFDLNGDSINDLQFLYSYSSYSGYYGGNSYGDLYAFGANGTGVTAGGPLSSGNLINDDSSFSSSNHLADYDSSWWYGSCGRWSCSPGGSSSYFSGTWNQGGNTVNGFLGFALSDGVDKYFGWADLTMSGTGYATIKDVAFESCANTGISAGQIVSSCVPTAVPEPSTLALLAIGAVGVGMMRRRRKIDQ